MHNAFIIEIQEKCYGNFFCPEDQKISRTDALDHEYVDVCLKTNYGGYVYWGEYSLCFAAVLHQEECFRLVLSRGKYIIFSKDANRKIRMTMLIIIFGS